MEFEEDITKGLGMLKVDYKDRVKENAVVNFCQNKTETHKEYDNTFENLEFYGLNHDDKKGRFNAVLIDEADAFTLNMKDLCIIPKDVMKGIISSEDIEAIEYFKKVLKIDVEGE